MKTLLTAFVVGVVAFVPVLLAQAPAKPLTNAELRAKVAALEQELLGLQNDQRLIMMACQSVPTTITSADTGAADRLQRAAATLASAQNAQVEAKNQRDYLEQLQRLENDAWYVKDAAFGATESNSVFVRYGWKVTIKNGIARPQTFDLVVQFLNSKDLVIDTARLYRQTIAAQDEQVITGDKLVSLPGALMVAKVKAIATRNPAVP